MKDLDLSFDLHSIGLSAASCDLAHRTHNAPAPWQSQWSRTNLLVLHWLQDLDYTLGAIRSVHALEHLAVLPPPDLSYDLIVVLCAAKQQKCKILRLEGSTAYSSLSTH